MTSRKVIVFGPTGAVGSAAACTAAELGAHVVLAMRDTNKSIPGLSADAEKQGKFERVQADLTKPDTVSEAVTKTGAKYAFFYLAFGMPNGMKATVEALKSAGIESVVFLSSFTVRGKLEDVQQSDVIPWAHAQVEISLTEVFGEDRFVPLRPGSFSSNNMQYKKGLEDGLVKITGPDMQVDNIVPEDIGRVGGTVLAKGLEGKDRVIYLYGEELLTQRETVEVMAKVLGKSAKIEKSSEEEAIEMFKARGIPAPLMDYMIRRSRVTPSAGLNVFGYSLEKEELKNVQKYTGKKFTTFEEWMQTVKGAFA